MTPWPAGALDAQIAVLRDARATAQQAVQLAEQDVVATGNPVATMRAIDARQLVHDFTAEIDGLQSELCQHVPSPRPPRFGS